MRIVRYAVEGGMFYGLERPDGLFHRLQGFPFERQELSGEVDNPLEARLLLPIERPRIFGLGYNYVAHMQETGKPVPDLPVLFMKPSTSAIGPDEAILYPPDGENIHFEGELAVVISRQARHVPEADALDYVLGYTCGNDVSDRVLQRRESQFGCLLAGKGYDTFAPLGPVISNEVDPLDARIRTRVNGELRQEASTNEMLFSVPYVISYLSRFITLLPGDVIMTGTPSGVGPLAVGDVIEIEIEGIGVLRNHVEAEPAR